MQRQSEPLLGFTDRFKSFRQKIKADEQYKIEKGRYEASLKNIPKIGKDETFDFEHT